MRLKVLTFNVFKLGGRVPPERVIARLLALEPDLLALQEVFDTPLRWFGFRARNARKLLERALERDYAIFWSPASGPRRLERFRDGLLLARRKGLFVPLEERYMMLRRGRARRILQVAVVRSSDPALVIAFCNTHLSSGDTPKQRVRRQAEIKKARSLLAEVEAEHHPDTMILTGDLNSPEGTKEHGLLVSAQAAAGRDGFVFEDTWRALHPAPEEGSTFALENSLVRRRSPRREASVRLDYVLLRRPVFERPGTRGLTVASSSVVLAEPDASTGEHLSDHFGVLTELELA